MLARGMYPTNSALFMKRFEEATFRPYGYLVVNLKSSTSEQNRLRSNILESMDKLATEDGAMSDCPNNEDEDETSTGFIDHFGLYLS